MKKLRLFILLTSIFILLAIILLLSFFFYTRFKDPLCGGYLDPNMRWCQNSGKMVSGTPVPTDCDPQSPISFTTNLSRFLEYLYIQSHRAEHRTGLSDTMSAVGKTYKGFLFFALPELLKILPTDFGQNFITPYGIISFYDSYFSCIKETDSFCKYLFQKQDNVGLQWLCQEFLKSKSQSSSPCPFSLTDHSDDPSVLIKNVDFFNTLGLLGAFPLANNQAVVFFSDLPVQDLGLNYWSYTVYIADSYNANAQCSPYRQAYVASISSAMNMFTAVGVSKKKFNPLTAETGTVKKGHVCFYTIITSNSDLSHAIRTTLESAPPYPFDFIYTFEIPAGHESIKLDPDLPNPNRLDANEPGYQSRYQRLCCFLRLSPKPGNTDSSNLQKLIYGQDPYTFLSDVVLVESSTIQESLYDSYTLPSAIDPVTNEKQVIYQQWQTMQHRIKTRLKSSGRSLQVLKTRNSTLNIFAPLYKKILNTNKPYQGGFQAIQLAGNGQGDNNDTQYRLSQSTCMTQDTVLVAVCVNHAFLGNTIYNSINVVDTNRAYGYAATVLDDTNTSLFYVVLIGRDNDLLAQTEAHLKTVVGHETSFHKIYVRTGSSGEGSIPECHQVLLVERAYLNPLYSSIAAHNTTYHVKDLFGSNLDSLNTGNDIPQDAWDSLVNVVRPANETMISPLFLKTYTRPSVLLWVVCLLLVIFVLLWIWLLTRSRH